MCRVPLAFFEILSSCNVAATFRSFGAGRTV
uniref:Uncharacterized protein n=1 Tax=Anopheles dirus TaxID=7168 RepID=A0A182NWY3_9DIPT